MAFRTRRQHRFQVLRNAGFMPFEAKELSKVPFRVPYFDILIKERFKFLQKALKEGWSKDRYQETILRDYRSNHWIRRTLGGAIASKSAWNMFRATEESYRRKYPNYVSPWQKRVKDFRAFTAKVEKTIRQHREEWIVQLDKSIARASGAKKIQLEKQRENLQSWIK